MIRSAALCLWLLGVAACGSSDPAGVELQLTLGESTERPSYVKLTWVSTTGYLFRDRRVPETGSFSSTGSTLATLFVEASGSGERLVFARGFVTRPSGDVAVAEGLTKVMVPRSGRVQATLRLVDATFVDANRNGMPDEVECYPMTGADRPASCGRPRDGGSADAGDEAPDAGPDGQVTTDAQAADAGMVADTNGPDATVKLDGPRPDGGVDTAPAPPDAAPLPDAGPDAAADAQVVPDASPPDATTTPDVGAPRLPALLVSGTVALTSGEQVLKSTLERMGWEVVAISDFHAKVTDAQGKAVVVLPLTIDSTNVAARFRDVTVPVVVLENYIYDDMKMTGPTAETDYGLFTTTDVAVVMPAHPMAAGLTGTIAVATGASSRVAWGVPASNAVSVSTVVGNARQVAVFGYQAGAPMVGLNAPARRVGLGMSDGMLASLTPQGTALLEAALRWAIEGR